MATNETKEKIEFGHLVAGQSTMAELIRAHAWSSTALGPIESWSETLLSQVNLVLCFQFPATLIWGPERIFLYNDASIPNIGAAHPSGLGCSLSRVFGESWDRLRPVIDSCFLQGETPMQQNMLIPMQRNGRMVDAYWTCFLIPVYDHGHIPGIRCIYQETTETVLAKRERDALAECLTQILDATSDAIVSLGPDWRITYMNPRALHLFGAAGPTVGTICWESFPLQVYPGSPFVENYERAMYQRIACRFEAWYPEPLNMWFQIEARPAREGIVTFIRDVTAERRSEEALRASEERLMLAHEYGRVATWEWNVFTGGFTWTGDTESIYGRRAEELDAFNRITPFLHDEDRERTVRAIWDSIEDGRAFNQEFRVIWPDGSIHWILARARPVMPSEGPAVRMIGINVNITDCKRIELEMQAERKNLSELFEQAPAFIAVLAGPDHVFQMTNRSYREMVGNRDLIGRTMLESMPEAEGQGFITLLDCVYRTGREHLGHRARLALARTPGEPLEERFVDYVYQPRRDSYGKVCGIITLGIDVTERHRAEQALIQAEKLAAVGRLASSIAHEINNPLAAVTNYLYLAEASDSMDEIRQYLTIIEREVWRVSTISNQTLLSQRQSTSIRSITFQSLVDGVLSLYRSRLEDLAITVEATHRARYPLVCLEGDIRQVLGNLIVNAIDAMQNRGGRLLLRGRESIDWTTGQPIHKLTIADNGSGIPANVLKKIFNPFFTTKGFAGNGLGLWISHEIVARQRGRFQVRSSTRQGGHGTIFVLSLPLTLPANRCIHATAQQ